jgi:hypothetical protein
MANKIINLTPSTIETIDQAMFNWLDSTMNLSCTMKDGFKKVPVSWVVSERSHKAKANKNLRDSSGALILPVISLERTSIKKDPSRKGAYWGHVPPNGDHKGGSITISRRINQEKTSNFANADSLRKQGQLNFPRPNKKIVYETLTIPMPVYVDVTYSINVMTQYQQQMNEISTPFMTKTGAINYFLIEHEQHRFESFIQQEFTQDNNVSALDADERIYKTKVEIKVLGHLIGEDKNQESPKIVIRENAVEVKIPRERVIYGDIPDHNGKDGFYRE